MLYVGLDVHKETIAVAVAEDGKRAEVREHGEIANTPAALTKLLGKLGGPGMELHACYEARPCGYGIQDRWLLSGTIVPWVAPSPIPRRPGPQTSLTGSQRSGPLLQITRRTSPASGEHVVKVCRFVDSACFKLHAAIDGGCTARVARPFAMAKEGTLPMATQPPNEPNHIEPQSPPEAPPAPAEPIEPYPRETEPLSPDFDQPDRSPEELPGLN